MTLKGPRYGRNHGDLKSLLQSEKADSDNCNTNSSVVTDDPSFFNINQLVFSEDSDDDLSIINKPKATGSTSAVTRSSRLRKIFSKFPRNHDNFQHKFNVNHVMLPWRVDLVENNIVDAVISDHDTVPETVTTVRRSWTINVIDNAANL